MTDSQSWTDKHTMPASAVQHRGLETSEVVGKIAVPSLAELYERYLRYVWRCLRSLGVAESELDDSIQDVFLVVQKRLGDFDGRVSPKTWLYAITIRVARRYRERYRRAYRHDAIGDEHEPELPSTSNTEVTLDHNQRLEYARHALRALDDAKREVFVLAQIEQMSATEIADVTGLGVNTVYSRLRAARLAFAAEIKRMEARSRRSA
jgi:RNA polymerase sigma-70 factor (ECF subfamily)